MKIARPAAHLGRLLGRMPGVLAATHGLALGAVLAAGAFAPAAHAVVVLSPAANIAVPVSTAGIYINVVTGVSSTAPAGAPGWDLNPWGSGSPFMYTGVGGGYVTGPNSSVSSLTSGATIGAASTYSTASPAAVTFGALAGQWTLNSANYFGFRFVSEDSLVHYGYGVMTVGATALTRTVTSLWYEDVAGASITISAVPELSSSAMLLAGGAVGALVLRRRRQVGR